MCVCVYCITKLFYERGLLLLIKKIVGIKSSLQLIHNAILLIVKSKTLTLQNMHAGFIICVCWCVLIYVCVLKVYLFDDSYLYMCIHKCVKCVKCLRLVNNKSSIGVHMLCKHWFTFSMWTTTYSTKSTLSSFGQYSRRSSIVTHKKLF